LHFQHKKTVVDNKTLQGMNEACMILAHFFRSATCAPLQKNIVMASFIVPFTPPKNGGV
jgi:hypothetical protein